ncbi:hydroxyethylthiazole kinase [Leptospira santarosai]|uniref:hydroxyethylthiazole kinase n=1 Tax=Leptospira santarosai TaxID=28183 RepID=UPI0002BD94E1|nr:hydroxyethylthiazole kinase [Leptospira santarosai]AVV51761.1 Hydroxyethylthiazole kinase [Leptospira santarosai]AVV78416.1 Hydroxyethylthiazole kinase [Leptospira santarosai]EMM86321.1 hydroxyethylthiazole kinase [Leptospira santarosai str. 2000027870]MDI7164806.1 hydroxyethylthiazole kinase [Leptospira santarosai]OLY61958.1 hydroxyethylthiazole kinase [Leptospira santarosai serovar Guaricura]
MSKYPIVERVWPAKEIVEDLFELRKHSPLTHVMTNIVVTNWTANVLLAVGSSPAMVIAEEEAEEFAKIASGLLINLGTVTSNDVKSMKIAATAAHQTHTPWVLDPVAAGAIGFRTEVAKELLDLKPTVIRGNASEILALSGTEGKGKGVDSTANSTDALPYAQELSGKTGSVVAVSGAVDYVTNGKETIAIPGGDPIMTKVTGVGCSLGALIASFLGIQKDPLRASSSASAIFAIAGSRSAKESNGPGSFAVTFLDQLSRLSIESE